MRFGRKGIIAVVVVVAEKMQSAVRQSIVKRAAVLFFTVDSRVQKDSMIVVGE